MTQAILTSWKLGKGFKDIIDEAMVQLGYLADPMMTGAWLVGHLDTLQRQEQAWQRKMIAIEEHILEEIRNDMQREAEWNASMLEVLKSNHAENVRAMDDQSKVLEKQVDRMLFTSTVQHIRGGLGGGTPLPIRQTSATGYMSTLVGLGVEGFTPEEIRQAIEVMPKGEDGRISELYPATSAGVRSQMLLDMAKWFSDGRAGYARAVYCHYRYYAVWVVFSSSVG